MSRHPRIIGICGHIHHGKSVFARKIQEFYGIKTVDVISMADAMRDIALVLVGSRIVTSEEKDATYKVGSRDLTGREVLQTIGNIGRRFDPFIWTTAFVTQVKSSNKPIVICDDVRMHTEANLCEFMIFTADSCL